MQEYNEDIKLGWTGERYVPELKGNIQLEHLHRYAMARELVKDKIVLDIACGEGYGSMLLSSVASCVVGVDLSEEAIDSAQVKYHKDNISFKTGTCDKIPLEDSSVDVVVSFETIEHHDQHEAMISEIKRVLKKDGLLIISSPDKRQYSDIPGNDNPFHKKELYHDEFRSLLKNYFNNVVIYGQRVLFGSGIFPESGKSQTVTYDMKEMEKDHFNSSRFKGLARPLYFIALASDAKLPSATGSMLEQPVTESDAVANVSKELLRKEQQIFEQNNTIASYRDELYSVYTSRSWRYTSPLRSTGHVVRRVAGIIHQPRIRAIIKRVYFLLPGRIRCSTVMENLKNRFKSTELKQ